MRRITSLDSLGPIGFGRGEVTEAEIKHVVADDFHGIYRPSGA